MKLKLLFFSIQLFLVCTLYSQTNQSKIDIATQSETILTFTINQYNLQSVRTPKGMEQIIVAQNGSSMMQKGAPDLPKFTESLIIPDIDNMKVEVVDSKFIDVPNISIAPSKGNFSRTILPKNVPYEYGKPYEEDAFFPGELAKLDSPYIIRDYRGQALQVYPFQYNPVSKVLRIFTEIKVRVFSDGEIGQNTLDRITPIEKIDKDFDKIYTNHFKNYKSLNTNYTPLGEEGKMLIICNDAWMSEMVPLINWKNSIGRPTEIVTVSTAGGSASSIRNYVSNYYAAKGLTYLLLVGDAEQVPTNNGIVAGIELGGDSDNAYAYITGNDHYQDFFVGRFSAETAAQVTTQVQRTIDYEKGTQLEPNWLNKIISIASQEGPGDDNELDYQHLRNIQPDLLGFTYQNPVYEFFEGSQGDFDAQGNPTAESVSNALNSGAGIINYVGHGSDTSWATSGFSGNDADDLLNHNKLPFIFDVACVNGNFVGQTTFAEYWMRSQDNNQPTGAIAICASTINQSWSPPMVGQDEMNDILVGTATTGIKKTFGGIIVNGFFKMNDETSDFAMTDTWTCFGDPSLLVRTDNPAQMIVSHNNVVVVGAETFQVNCSFEGAFATLSYNGQIIGSASVSGGTTSIPVSALVPGQVISLVIIGFNQVSYISEITVINTSGSYLVVDNLESNTINFGQTKNINLALKNVGLDNATNAGATVTCSDTNATITNNIFNFGQVIANAITPLSSDSFTLQVDNDLVDQYPVAITIQMTDASNEIWNETKTIYVNAPKFTIANLTIFDTTGNNNGILDPGETALVKIEVTNNGHASITNVIGTLTSNNIGLLIANATTLPYGMAINGNQLFEFSITANSSIIDGTSVQLNFGVTGGVQNQYTNQKDFVITVGFVPSYCDGGSNNSEDEYISNVEFGSINNVSQRTFYSDFTSISTEINRGQSYPISITNGEHFGGDQMGCWIDWNYNGDFTDENEYFAINYSNPVGTGTILVPENARIGSTRMRLRLMYDGSILPCGNTNYGEVEDYTVNILPSLSSQIFENDKFMIYPNPSNGNFTLKIEKNTEKVDSIEIYTINGQLIYRKTTVSSLNQIELKVSKGIYLLKISHAGKNSYEKVIVN
jgi:hypothetical protein